MAGESPAFTNMKTVAMYGPSISDPSKVVNRLVPEADVVAYKNAGYRVGSVVEPEGEPQETPKPAVKGKVKK